MGSVPFATKKSGDMDPAKIYKRHINALACAELPVEGASMDLTQRTSRDFKRSPIAIGAGTSLTVKLRLSITITPAALHSSIAVDALGVSYIPIATCSDLPTLNGWKRHLVCPLDNWQITVSDFQEERRA